MRTNRLLLLGFLVMLAGCDDLKIEGADSFRFGGSTPERLTYKDKDIPDDPSKVTCAWFADDKPIGTGTAVVVSGLSAGKHALKAKVTYDGKSDEVKRTIKVENDEPVVTIAPLASKKFGVGSPIDLAASATDREDGPVSALSWQVDSKNRGAGATLQVADLVPGKHAITALAVDRAGATGKTKVEVEITNQAPTVTIETGSLTTRVYRAVELRGTATDPDPLRDPARIPVDRLEWVSNKQGSLGQGESLNVTNLLPGEHAIELRAKDEFGAVGKASIKVTVQNDAPVVEIKKPRKGDEINVGEEAHFECDASDPEDATLEDNKVTWRSQLDGELGHGRKLSTKKLRPGLHEISCTATDHFGATGSDRVELVVRNDPPSVTIESPADGATFSSKDRIELRAKGNAEDYDWFSDDKKIASGSKEKIDASKLGFGSHELRLRAKSKWGAETTASIRVTLVRKPFEVAITSPGDGSSFLQGAEVVLTGYAKDGDTGSKVAGSQLQWTTVYNQVEQPLGTGERLAIKTLGPGIHQIALTAKDPKDASVTRVATVRIRIQPGTTPTTATTTASAGPTTGRGITGAIGDANDTGH